MINTKKWVLLSIVFTSACLANHPTAPKKNKPPSPLPESDILQPNSIFSMAEGDIRVNGHPRFLTGTILLEGVDHDAGIKTTGYPANLAWLYESLPDYQNAQKLSLDIFGVTPEHVWRRIFRPKPIPRRNMTALNRPLQSGLPIIAELAIEKGSHAWMSVMVGVNPKEQAWIEGEAIGLPYSIVSNVGLELWTTIWRTSAQYFHDIGIKPFAYRLFAAADCFDTSLSAKTAFVTYLTDTFTSISTLNEAIDGNFSSFNQAGRFKNSTDNIGLHVLYTEFHEKAWLKALSRATNTVASVTGESSPAVFFQPQSLEGLSIDLFTSAGPQAILCAPAEQEHPILTALLLRAAASEKPILICDVPVRDDDIHLRNTLLTQFARGYSIALLGTWKRDARAWIRYKRKTPRDGGRPRTVLDPVATELAGQQHALTHPDHILNPYAVQTSTLAGIQMAKQDVFKISDLFASTHRASGINVALLHARTSARLRGTPRYVMPTNDIVACMTALTDSGYKLAAIAETQLNTLTNTPYRIIVASDSVFATQPETATQLTLFAQTGGTVILTAHALTRNKYGKKLGEGAFTPSDDWKRSELNGVPFLRQSFGSGQLLRFESSVTPEALRPLLDALITEANVPRAWEITDPESGKPVVGIEVAHAVDADNTHGLILFNRTETTRIVQFRLHGIKQPSAVDPIRKKLLPEKAGGFIIELKPQQGEIIIVTES